MKVVVLVKPVPEPETRLRPSADGRRLDPEGVKWVLAGYDESAVEQALLLKESVPDTTVRAVTLAPAPRGEEVLRACLALGCDAATWVEAPADFEEAPVLDAHLLSLVLPRYAPDLVLAGKQSGDEEGGLLPATLAEFLKLPSFDCVVNLRWDAAGSRFTLEEAVDGGLASVEVPAPVVVGLQQAWNDPRTAKLPNILKSRRMPIDRVSWADLTQALGAPPAPAVRRSAFSLPPPRTGAKLIEFTTPDEAAKKLVRALREEAKVFP